MGALASFDTVPQPTGNPPCSHTMVDVLTLLSLSPTASHLSYSTCLSLLTSTTAPLQAMGLQPGRNCVVGDGLALVDVGLYLDGVKVRGTAAALPLQP